MSMTNEQREAIEIIEKMIKSYIEADECGLSNNDFKYEIKAMQTLLSLIKEQEEEIGLMSKMIDKLSEYHPTDNEFCKEICIKEDIDCIDCIKQYFEKLAKKGE